MHALSGLTGGRVVWQGIDYAAARVAAHGLSLSLEGQLFADLRVMEGAALEVLNGA